MQKKLKLGARLGHGDGGQTGVPRKRRRGQDLLRLQPPAVAELAAPADLQLAQRALARCAQPVHKVGRTARVDRLRAARPLATAGQPSGPAIGVCACTARCGSVSQPSCCSAGLACIERHSRACSHLRLWCARKRASHKSGGRRAHACKQLPAPSGRACSACTYSARPAPGAPGAPPPRSTGAASRPGVGSKRT